MKRSLSFVAAALVTLAGAAAWAETYQLHHGPRTPAAAASVDFDKGKDGNNQVSLKAQYLALPKDLASNAKAYAVWIDPGMGKGPMLVGTITPDKNREAKLDITTPYPNFDMLVTAESQPTPTQPSNLVILRGHVGKPPEQGGGGQ